MSKIVILFSGKDHIRKSKNGNIVEKQNYNTIDFCFYKCAL
jgi:hypothetical protein